MKKPPIKTKYFSVSPTITLDVLSKGLYRVLSSVWNLSVTVGNHADIDNRMFFSNY